MHGEGLVPMDIAPLMAQTDLPPPITRWIEDLIAVKRETGEMGSADVTNPEVDALLDQEFEAAKTFVTSASQAERPDLWTEADALHRRWVHRVTP